MPVSLTIQDLYDVSADELTKLKKQLDQQRTTLQAKLSQLTKDLKSVTEDRNKLTSKPIICTRIKSKLSSMT